MDNTQANISQSIGSLVTTCFKISNPLSQLNQMRDKILIRGYQAFDKPDIMDELGRLQHVTGEIHAAMLKIHDLLQQQR